MSLQDLLGSRPLADDDDDDGDAAMDSARSGESGTDEGDSDGQGGKGVDLMGDNTGDEDSSEEEDDDSEEERRVRKDFIVDEDETSSKRRRRKKKKRRKHGQNGSDAGSQAEASSRKRRKDSDEEQSGLDEDDLELLEENTGVRLTNRSTKKLKRLRRRRSVSPGSRSDASGSREGSLTNIFADDDDRAGAGDGLPFDADEMAGFIEDDETQSERGASDSDEDEDTRRKRRDRKRASDKRGKGGRRAGFGAGFVEGITAEAWQEVTDVFGNGQDYAFALEDDDEDEKAKELKDIFEPSEIASRMLTAEDDHIRHLDIPERMQLASASLKQPEIDESGTIPAFIAHEDLLDAARWMSRRISTDCTERFCLEDPTTGEPPLLHDEFIQVVRSVLEFINIDFLEVPFIWQHRSDYLVKYGELDQNTGDHTEHVVFLQQEDCFRIEQLSIKYRALLTRKQELHALYNSVDLQDEYFDEYYENLDTIEDAADLADWLTMRHGAKLAQHKQDLAAGDDAENGHSQPQRKKRATRESAYENAKKSVVSKLAESIGLAAPELSRAVSTGTRNAEIEDPPALPLEHAEAYSGSIEYPSPNSALSAAKMICVHEISRDPFIRQEIRRYFEKYSVVSVKPTEKGVQKIDDMHPFFAFKYLLNKPYSMFQRTAQFLQIRTAEREGLVTSTISLPPAVVARFLNSLSRGYLSDLTSSSAEAWNTVRSEILEAALQEFLLPHGETWAKSRLHEDEEEFIGRLCNHKLLNRIDMAPYCRSDGSMGFGDTPSVLALSNGMGDPKRDDIVGVYLDSEGHFREHLKISNLYEPSDGDKEALTELLKRRRPQVVVVGGFSPNAEQLRKQFVEFAQSISAELVENRVDQADDDEPQRSLEELQARALFETNFVHDDVARIYSNSQRAGLEFPDLGKVGKYCVGLARYAQSPLNEYAALGPDLTALSFEPNQKFVSKEKIQAHLDRGLIQVVNKVGVDVNKAMRNPYYAHLLSYVCGLGPRKADLVVKKINSQFGGTLPSRFALIASQILTNKVGENAAAFLRIPQDDLNADLGREDSEDNQPEVLDDTRIHPENYDIARKMAADAMEIDEEDEQGQDVKSHAVHELLHDDVRKLDELSLDDFANELLVHLQRRKRFALYSIRDELKKPYAELRQPFRTPDPTDIFTMLSGETRATLDRGFIIPVRVVRVLQDDSIYVRLDSGLQGTIPATETAQDNYMSRDGKPRPGHTIQALVTDVRPDAFEVELSIRRDLVAAGDKAFRQTPYDPNFYDNDEKNAESAARSAIDRKTAGAGGRQKRVINHPNFHNVDAGGAEELLMHMQRGDCIIRPSSKEDHLAVTWKVAEGIYQHIAVVELGKESEYSLGKTLRIGNRDYSDLDELIVAHIKQMAVKVTEMVNHDKWRGTKEQLTTYLSNSAQGDPHRAFYGFCFDPDRRKAGQFLIGFRVNLAAEAQFWPVRLMPGTFIFLGHEQPSMLSLCNAFKQNYIAKSSSNPARLPAGGRTPYLNAGGRTPLPGGRTPGGGAAGGGRTPMASRGGAWGH